jgi:hypothetical protein
MSQFMAYRLLTAARLSGEIGNDVWNRDGVMIRGMGRIEKACFRGVIVLAGVSLVLLVTSRWYRHQLVLPVTEGRYLVLSSERDHLAFNYISGWHDIWSLRKRHHSLPLTWITESQQPNEWGMHDPHGVIMHAKQPIGLPLLAAVDVGSDAFVKYHPDGTELRAAVPPAVGTNYAGLWITHWLCFVLLAIWPARLVFEHIRRQHRCRRGLCGECATTSAARPAAAPNAAWRPRRLEPVFLPLPRDQILRRRVH